MLKLLFESWFLATLFTFITLGVSLGYFGPGTIEAIHAPASTTTKLLTPIVLLLMSVTLDSGRMWKAIKSPGPVLWAALVNFGILPLLAIPLLQLQLHADYVAGLMLAASVPCTMAAASVWTRKAGGNDAVSMLVTILTNGLCFLLTPMWLQWGIGQHVVVDTWDMMIKLAQSALLPILVGQLLRIYEPLRILADRNKTPLGVAAQFSILLILLWSALQQGARLATSSAQQEDRLLVATLVVGCSVFCLHITGLLIAHFGGRWLGFNRVDLVAVTFAGSQKTLPIGVYIASVVMAQTPFAVYPILMFHIMQLVIDTLLLERLRIWSSALTTERS